MAAQSLRCPSRTTSQAYAIFPAFPSLSRKGEKVSQRILCYRASPTAVRTESFALTSIRFSLIGCRISTRSADISQSRRKTGLCRCIRFLTQERRNRYVLFHEIRCDILFSILPPSFIRKGLSLSIISFIFSISFIFLTCLYYKTNYV